VHFAPAERHNRTVIIFVTVCTHDRNPLLANEPAHHLLMESWEMAESYRVGGYVVMPDHVHLFCTPTGFPLVPLARWMRYWKSHVARKWPGQLPHKLWQRDHWDTQLRQAETYAEKWAYVRNNSVRAGLVHQPEDWPFQGKLHDLEWHD